MIQSKVKESGVSPVIGIILMVAVTVILVALASNVVFDLGSDVGESPKIALEFDKDAGTVKVIRNDNVDALIYDDDDSSDDPIEKTNVDAGTTHNLATGEIAGDNPHFEPITVTAVVDGEEQVVRTVENVNVSNTS